MNTVKLFTIVPCLLVLLSVFNDVSCTVRRVRAVAPKDPSVEGRRTLSQSPLNHAAIVGETVVIECSVVNPPPASRIMWGEYITNAGGSIISDNDVILGHPNGDRYRILHFTETQFDLEIRDVRLSDGGRYVCQNTLSGPPDVYRGEAELIILDGTPNCTTTAPLDGNVLEGQTYTIECIIHYQGLYPPTMTWTGPPPFLTANSPPNPTTVWSGVEYTVDRSMDTRAFECLTNFTSIGNVPADVASNTPDWSHLFRANQIFVFWGPKNMYVTPSKLEYEAGDVLTCFADAFPDPSYQWQNMRTLEIVSGRTFTVTQSMVGFNQTMRCQAQNLIQGFVYSDNIFLPVYVPAPTSPPTDPVTSPTTTPPAEGPCDDLSGRWVAQNPYADLILEVIHDSEIGEIRGIMKNSTDTIWVEVIGTARRSDFMYVGLTAIFPFQNGITGLAGECHKCHGVEKMMTESLWRSKAQSSSCGVGSPTAPDAAFNFARVGSSSILREQEFDVMHPTKEVSGRLGIRLKKRR